MNYRGSIRVAVCACGAPVVGSHKQPDPKRFWCAGCVGFVEAAIDGSVGFSGHIPATGIDLVAHLAMVERQLIETALNKSNCIAEAARLLGLNRTTLVEKLNRLRREGRGFPLLARQERWRQRQALAKADRERRRDRMRAPTGALP